MKIHLVRSARTDADGAWSGEELLRPLSTRGREEAEAIADQLGDEPLTRVISSPMLRCQQTAEPLAVARGLPVEVDERLAPGEDVARALELLSTLGEAPVMLCSHGNLISSLLGALELGDDGNKGRVFCKRGSIWILDGQDYAPARATYLEPVRRSKRGRGRHFTAREASRPCSVRAAVLDLGSTSFALQVADVLPDGQIRPVVREKVMLRLGAVIATNSRIPDDVCERTLSVARDLGKIVRQEKVQRFLPVATAALREAENGRKLAHRIGKRLGEPVRVLSGAEEARIMFRAFRGRLKLGEEPVLGLDLGGGSLELAVGSRTRLEMETTLKLGVVRLHGELVRSDPLSDRDVAAVRARVRNLLAPHSASILQARPVAAVAAGGTARSLLRLLEEASPAQPTLEREASILTLPRLREIRRRLVGHSHDERLQMRGMRRRRADLLPTGAIVLETLALELGLEGFTVSDWGLREGVMLEATARAWQGA